MLNILLRGHDYKYELSEFLKLFSSEFSYIDGSEDFDVKKGIDNLSYNGNLLLINTLNIDNKCDKIILESTSKVYKNGMEIYSNTENAKIGLNGNIKGVSKRIIQKSMFEYMKKEYDTYVPWGILTGIRPVKIVHALIDEGKSDKEILTILKNDYLISDDKIELLMDVAKRERLYIYPLDQNKISLYVSIPFCPTRCLYCSFPSHTLEKYGNLRKVYIEKLLEEAKGLNKLILLQDKEIESLYIGGGTPTSLDAEDLDYLITELYEIFDLSKVKEFTVEAGRPDSITKDKLSVLKKNNVGRISINPQTMNQVTLDRIGRKHTADDIVDCYKMAREVGFDNINMDLILGLPGETPEMVEHTMKKIVSLNPESVTVHTLALKRASELKMNMESYAEELSSYKSTIEMIAISKEYMKDYGYQPYYMYRQKHMLGNLENIGYAKEGYECLYNMQIMEEKQSNYAIGAGAVSKFVYLDENRIERVDDVKNVEIYIERLNDMLEKKIKEVEKNANKCSKGN